MDSAFKKTCPSVELLSSTEVALLQNLCISQYSSRDSLREYSQTDAYEGHFAKAGA